MKYKLININTKEEHLCDKVTIDGFDYYVSEEQIKIGDKGWLYEDGYIKSLCEFDCTKGLNGIRISDRKVIATNNPNIDIPKIVDEVESFIKKTFYSEDGINFKRSTIGADDVISAFKEGCNKSQETHPFTEEDMIEFANFHFREEFNATPITTKTTKELFEIWKEQQPKTIWYE